MVDTMVLFVAIVNVGKFFCFLAENGYFNHVVSWRSLARLIIEKTKTKDVR